MSVLYVSDARPSPTSTESRPPREGRLLAWLLLVLLWVASAGLLALGVHAAALVT